MTILTIKKNEKNRKVFTVELSCNEMQQIQTLLNLAHCINTLSNPLLTTEAQKMLRDTQFALKQMIKHDEWTKQ